MRVLRHRGHLTGEKLLQFGIGYDQPRLSRFGNGHALEFCRAPDCDAGPALGLRLGNHQFDGKDGRAIGRYPLTVVGYGGAVGQANGAAVAINPAQSHQQIFGQGPAENQHP